MMLWIVSRQTYLEWNDQHEEALANSRRLLAISNIPAEYREALLSREAFNLFRLGRIDEGLSQYDRRIAAASDDPENRLHLLGRKAQMILGRDRLAQSIDIWQIYSNATTVGTDDWFTATAVLARELQRAGRHEEALKIVNEFLNEDRMAWVLLDAAESCIALGQYTEAAGVLEEAQAKNQALKDSPRRSDVRLHQRILKRISKLTQSMPDLSTPNVRNRNE